MNRPTLVIAVTGEIDDAIMLQSLTDKLRSIASAHGAALQISVNYQAMEFGNDS